MSLRTYLKILAAVGRRKDCLIYDIREHIMTDAVVRVVVELGDDGQLGISFTPVNCWDLELVGNVVKSRAVIFRYVHLKRMHL